MAHIDTAEALTTKQGDAMIALADLGNYEKHFEAADFGAAGSTVASLEAKGLIVRSHSLHRQFDSKQTYRITIAGRHVVKFLRRIRAK